MSQSNGLWSSRPRFKELRRGRGRAVAVAFQVGARTATVRVTQVGTRLLYDFPHLDDETGESLGDDDLDAALRSQAQSVVAFLEAAGKWRAFRSGRL
jgi:hypothetical protein